MSSRISWSKLDGQFEIFLGAFEVPVHQKPKIGEHRVCQPERFIDLERLLSPLLGFEVDNLESFCKKLEERGVTFRLFYRTIPEWDVSLAFIIDQWGTYIELTEGLDKL